MGCPRVSYRKARLLKQRGPRRVHVKWGGQFPPHEVIDLATGKNIAFDVPLRYARKMRRIGVPFLAHLFRRTRSGDCFLEGWRLATRLDYLVAV